MQTTVEPLASILEDPALSTVFSATTKSGIPLSILRFNVTAAGPQLKRLHARMHPLVRFYIDGASELDQTDARLEALLAVLMVDGIPVAVPGLLTYFRCAAFEL